MDVTFFKNQPFYPKANIKGEILKEYQLWGTSHSTPEPEPDSTPNQAHIPSSITEPEPAIQKPSPNTPEPIIQKSNSNTQPIQETTGEDLIVYYSRRMKTQQEVENDDTFPKQNQDLEPDPAPEKHTGNTLIDSISSDFSNDLDQPIAVRE